MSNANEKRSSNSRSPLERWIYQTIAVRGLRVKFRLRGNNLHLLLEHQTCPERTATLLWLIPALQETNLNTLLPEEQPPIYQIQLYVCEAGQPRPNWTASIYLNQLQHHLDQLQVEQPATEFSFAAPTSATSSVRPATPPIEGTDTASLALSNRHLAKQGQETAIACYLSETISDWGVAVRVSAKTVPYTPPAAVYSTDSPLNDGLTTRRLWIACQAAYGLDPGTIGEPITQKLRELEIEGYRDAVIVFQVAGESRPDWLLRVDLTPPTEMLREWARWGDVEAIQRLVNQDLQPWRLEVSKATLTDTTLHLCTSWLPIGEIEIDQKRVKADVALLLEALGPQGIHAAMLYGPANEEVPSWVEWLQLPAALHAAFAEMPITLAQQADWSAIAFLLHRLLNPDLNSYLLMGGIRLQLLPKDDPNAGSDVCKTLLHVMAEGTACPDQQHVSTTIVRFMRQLRLPTVSGVRIYGRRAGQKKPLWSYGTDFVTRKRLVPEVTPEFAATADYVQDLIAQPDEPILRPDLTPADLQAAWTNAHQRAIHKIQSVLTRSHLFVYRPDPQPPSGALPGRVSYQGASVGLIWSAVGLLLLVQGNWLLGSWVRSQPTASEAETRSTLIAPSEPVVASEAPPSPQPQPVRNLPKLSLQKSPAATGVFNTEGFTRSTDEPIVPASTPMPRQPQTNRSLPYTPSNLPQANRSLPYTPPNPQTDQIAAEIQAQATNLPTFNSRQLDQKLQLYYKFLEESGTPDVLIVGSSRALRGIDPIALKKSLANLGYSDLKIFNFGLNGATAQVVDLLLERILTPEQLPRLVIWADGARAFNSGTTDITYNGVVASAAFRQLTAGTFPIPTANADSPATPETTSEQVAYSSLTLSYDQIDRWLSQQLASVARVYQERDRLKHLIQGSMTGFMPDTPESSATTANSAAPASSVAVPRTGQPLPDLQGFLPLAIQFNPATYYQKYARVIGQYDSDYKSFRIQGEQETALKSFLRFTKAREIPVIFVNLPLTEDYLDPYRMRHEQGFRQYMVNLAMQSPGFTFRDLSEKWTTNYPYFSDPSHLNRYGAYAVSRILAQDPMIPWAKARSKTLTQQAEAERSNASNSQND